MEWVQLAWDNWEVSSWVIAALVAGLLWAPKRVLLLTTAPIVGFAFMMCALGLAVGIDEKGNMILATRYIRWCLGDFDKGGNRP